jgi:hypothetical protein
MSFFGSVLLGLFVLPVMIGGCLPDPRGGVPWYEARRDPTGLALDPTTTAEAVIQVYAARAVSWRGVLRCTPGWWSSQPASPARRVTRWSGLASQAERRRYASTGWAPTITGSAPGRRSSSIGVAPASMP